MAKQFRLLRSVIQMRSHEWDSTLTKQPLFRAVELGGEIGEANDELISVRALNEVKKLEREKSGIVGSTSTYERLADELADVIITVFRLAACYGIDLWAAVTKKFNDTSDKYGMKTRIVEDSLVQDILLHELDLGDFIRADNGFICIPTGAILEVRSTDEGQMNEAKFSASLYVNCCDAGGCSNNMHFLEGQKRDDGTLAGFSRVFN